MLHLDIEDSGLEPMPGVLVNVQLDGVNSPSNTDLLALANDIVASNVIQHVPWSGTATLNAVWIDSQTTLYPTE